MRHEKAGQLLELARMLASTAEGLTLDEMAERLAIAIPHERAYHTAAGFVLNKVGHLPGVGESFNDQGWRFEVMDLDGRRIDKILATRLSKRRQR